MLIRDMNIPARCQRRVIQSAAGGTGDRPRSTATTERHQPPPDPAGTKGDDHNLHFHDRRHDCTAVRTRLEHPEGRLCVGSPVNSLNCYTHIRHRRDKYDGWPWRAVVTRFSARQRAAIADHRKGVTSHGAGGHGF